MARKKCIQCKRQFYDMGFWHVVTCPDCHAKQQREIKRAANVRPLRFCEACGQSFRGRTPWQRFCNRGCYLDYLDANRGKSSQPPKMHVMTCAHCGEDFEIRAGAYQRKYCGEACASAARTERTWREVPCNHCGKPLRRVLSKLSTNNYCGDDCRWAAKRKENPPVECRCAQCGGKFTVERASKRRKYCSVECKRASPTHKRGLRMTFAASKAAQKLHEELNREVER